VGIFDRNDAGLIPPEKEVRHLHSLLAGKEDSYSYLGRRLLKKKRVIALTARGKKKQTLENALAKEGGKYWKAA